MLLPLAPLVPVPMEYTGYCIAKLNHVIHSGVARNLIGVGVYVLTSHCNFKTCVNAPHVNKTDFGGIYTGIYPRRW